MRASGTAPKANTEARRAIAGRGRQRGQSLIVAVIVMFVLLFIGAVFVGIVARNLMNSGRARDTVTAAQFAEAGLKYADLFLQNSPLGADWRPAIAPVASLNPNDPDYNWLARGFSRVEMNRGRALIKVTYRPDLINDPQSPLNKILDPLGKYIKIESVGRVGSVNPNDPTTFLNSPSPRLRREYVAYKQIGLTDYLRFVTNLNKDTKAEAFFGVQPIGVPVFMQMGGLPINSFYPLPAFMKWTGAPMRVNGKLHLGNNLVLALDRRNGDVVQVADDIVVDPEVTGDPTRYRARVNVLEQTNTPNQDPTAGGATKPDPIIPTDGPFNSFGGLIRDAAGIPDVFGYVRAISRLDPPVIDAEDPSTGFTRYRQLTRGSGKYLPNPNNPNQPFDLGRIGLGSGVYIENGLDTDNNATAPDAETLTKRWLSPESQPPWQGPYYMAPGVSINFGYHLAHERDANGSPTGQDVALPGFMAIQNPGATRYFRDIQGQNISQSELTFTYFIYVPSTGAPVLKLDCDFYRDKLKQAPFNYTDPQIDKLLSDFNGVIFAEGNLKTRGLVPGVQNVPIRRESNANPLTDAQIREMISTSVTLVSNQNIYIESSLVREDAKAMVALLAVQNVVVNSTMFTLPANPVNWTEEFDSQGYIEIGSNTVQNFEFMFGENPAGYVDRNNQTVTTDLLVRHSAVPKHAAYINLFVNRWAPHTTGAPATGPQPLYWFNRSEVQSPGLPTWTYPLHNATDSGSNFEYKAFQLTPKQNQDPNNPYYFTNDAGYAWPQGLWNVIQPSVDSQYSSGADPGGSYLLGRIAVAPMDIRIEAVMYAQNGRFFIIPGVPFNNDLGTDSRTQDLARAQAAGLPAGTMARLNQADPKIPLAGEPIDCRITIIGAISENQTASPAEQAEWMKLWGWIPSTYGTTGHDANVNNPTPSEIPKGHLFVNDVTGPSVDMRFQAEKTAAFGDQGLARGIRFIYDPALSMPYVGYTPGNRSFRYDLANFNAASPTFDQDRTLPPLPRLPVCPGFVFSGEVR